jgi:hypothetical protein
VNARAILVLTTSLLVSAEGAVAQIVSQRGSIEVTGAVFPQDAPNDTVNLVGDVQLREEVFIRPSGWVQFAAGVDVRGNTHDQVEDMWRLDVTDRTIRRPPLSLRRASATFHRGPMTVDVGKQVIRWGKTDIVTPTDRFAPRDYLNVIESELLAVRGLRVVYATSAETFEGVVVPWLTPSRMPLVDQRWTVIPPDVVLRDRGAAIPDGVQTGVRWGHTGSGYEYSLSFFDGFNHLPTLLGSPAGSTAVASGEPIVIDFVRTYPRMRMIGGDVAWPTPWFTLKGEAGAFTSSTPGTDEYVLYVLQLERQTGEWVLVGGYAGSVITRARATVSFAPDLGTAKSLIGRASYTIDPNQTAAIEAAVRQNGDGLYVKGEYSRAIGSHWRATLTGGLIRGEPDDFIGQYNRNSHASFSLRYSF